MTRRSKPDSRPTAMPAAPLRIRAFDAADRDAVVELWRACGLVVPHNDPAQDIALCRATPHSELFVGEADGRIVATAMAGHDGHRGWLYYVAVSPGRRGTGAGRRLVDHSEAWLASLGVRKVNLIIRDTNLDVRGFYERLGYAVEPRCVMARWLVARPDSVETVT